MPEKQKAQKGKAAVMMVVLGSAYFFSNFHRLSLGVIGSRIQADYQLTTLQMGTLGSAIFYSYAAMQIPCGIIADRLPAKKIITLSCILTAAGTMWFAATENFVFMVLARGLTGAATALVYVPALTVIRKYFGDAVFGTMTGIMVAMGQMGAVCAAVPLKLLSDLFHWRAAFRVIGVVSIFLGIICYLVIPADAGQKQAAGSRKGNIKLSPAFLSITLWFFITGGARLSFQSLWGGRYFSELLGSSLESGVALMFISLGCIAGPLILGRVSDRIGSIKTVIYSTLLLSVTWIMLAMCRYGVNPAVLYLLCILLGAVGAGGFTVGFSCIRGFSDPANTGIMTGINNCCAFMGSAMFTQFCGNFMEVLPVNSLIEQYQVLLLVFAAASFTVIVLLGILNRKDVSNGS